jgi:predicted patatin/cPLA2 family phospholipase
MMSMPPRSIRALSAARVAVLATLVAAVIGCAGQRDHHRDTTTAVKAGMNTNDLVDLAAQQEADTLSDVRALFIEAEKLKKKPTPEQLARRRSVLCLSGGGSYGAYTAGVLCGWTAAGDRPGVNGRPNFDVVTGISTGALIAPFAFLGPQYDDKIRKFYTTVTSKDIYRLRPVRGLLSIALADNAPLEKLVDSMLTQQIIDEVAAEHRKGRRLYIGTTELEAKRFVCWDLGEIASRGCPGDRELIKKILMGTSAIPGFFPPAKIPVTVDGRPYVEMHGDGGTSTSVFFRPPYVPPEQRTPEALDLTGVDLHLMVAGKLYADAEPLKKRSLAIAGTSISGVLYAGTRADLQRYYLVALLNGMNYHVSVIPPEFPAPTSSTAFEKEAMTAMFNEGFSQSLAGTAWRSTPPAVEPGESMLNRYGTTLTYLRRGPSSVVIKGKPVAPPYLAPGPVPIPVPPSGPIK